jgi:mannan endo-1,4-beta-mannosidase
VKYVLTRFNRYTGLRYNEDPTIMTFELANEPRSRSDKTGQRLLAWVTQTSAYFKHLAPHQLVTTGDEGFYGDPANSDYPTWITSHLSDGAALHKPVVIEEYGLAISAAQGIADEAARDTGYRTWTGTVLARGGAGDQFWLLTSRVDDGSFYPDYDGYRIIWDNEPGNSTNAAAQLLSAHARAMAMAMAAAS